MKKIRCSNCNMFYDGDLNSICPYCLDTSVREEMSTAVQEGKNKNLGEKSGKRIPFFEFIRNGKSAPSQKGTPKNPNQASVASHNTVSTEGGTSLEKQSYTNTPEFKDDAAEKFQDDTKTKKLSDFYVEEYVDIYSYSSDVPSSKGTDFSPEPKYEPKSETENDNYSSRVDSEGLSPSHTNYVPILSEKVFLEEIEKKYSVEYTKNLIEPVVGEYYNSYSKKQTPLKISFSTEGNYLIYGATGNGKTTFLTTLCYSLIKNYSPEDVNLYIVDSGSGTLKAFEQAPHVGGVVLSTDTEKKLNLFNLLDAELENRKKLFSDFGGDYKSYFENTGNISPNIIVIINNYYTNYSDEPYSLNESFSRLTNEGVKYGIYFVLTAGTTSAVGYRLVQNFKNKLSLQLNDPSDYSVVLDTAVRMIPSKVKGRGLFFLDKIYEFQTAYCFEHKITSENIAAFCHIQQAKYSVKAKEIPKSLREEIDVCVDTDKTIGVLRTTTDSYPVVGWLVGLKGIYQGESFELHQGKNHIGRSLNMSIALAKEKSVSREKHVTIIFDPESSKFYIVSGESNALTYINGKLLLKDDELKPKDIIKIGNCEFVFIPLCDESFNWNNYIE